MFSFIHLPFSDKAINSLGGDEVRRIRMVNYISLISIANMFSYAVLYAILDISLFKPAIVWMFFGIVSCLVTMLVNRMGYHSSSKILLVVLNLIFMSSVSIWIFSTGPDFHTFLLVGSFIPLFLWSVRKPFWLIFFIFLNIACYVYIEFFYSNNQGLINLPENYVNAFQSTNVLVVFLSAGLAVAAFLVLSIQKETKLAQKNKELKQAQKHRDLVYSIIAHDLRSPFNGLLGLTELLVKNYDDYSDDKKKSNLMAIHNSSSSLNSLLENLLGWTKIQSGNINTLIEPIRLKHKTNEVMDLLADVAGKKKISLINNIPDELELSSDAYMLMTVIRNLITNALKFTEPEGSIAIVAAPVANKIEICISDNGIGIPKDKLPSLFELESNYMQPGTQSEKGSGLGLRLCKDFITALGGSISVESELGKGSNFCIQLPKNLSSR